MKKLLLLSLATGMAVAGMSWSAQAMPRSISPMVTTSVVTNVGWVCGPGMHLGPHGKYCWPNGVTAYSNGPCPRGYHLGPEGHICWRD